MLALFPLIGLSGILVYIVALFPVGMQVLVVNKANSRAFSRSLAGALSCCSGVITGSSADSSPVTKTTSASDGLMRNLSNSNSAVTVPSTLTASAGAVSAEFTATVASAATAQVVTMTACAESVFKNFTLLLNVAILALSNATPIGIFPMTINCAALTGVSETAFPGMLNPSQEMTLNIGFDPTALRKATGRLTISSNPSTSLSGISQPAMRLAVSNSTISPGSTQSGIITLGQTSENSTSIDLTSGSPEYVVVTPATLIVPPGQNTATFSFTGVAAGVSTISASATSYESASSQVTVTAPAIQASFFGLTVLNFENLTPSIPFGSTRSWDAYPDFDWADTNPAPGVYNFTYLDQFIAVNQARGVDIIYTLNRTPQWASSQPTFPSAYGPGQCAPPADMADYDSFLTAVATHAAGRIKYWELWNEPQSSPNYCGDIPTMVTMAQHASRIIKGIDRTALILSPAANGDSGPSWLSSFLAAGGSKYVDVIAFHGYWNARAEDVISVISKFKAAMVANGAGSKPIWDTESSWAGFGNLPLPSSSKQIGFIAKDYLLHWSNGVSRFVWYAYDGGSVWGGLMNSSPGESGAALSYSQTYKWLVGAALTSPCSKSANSIWTCTLSRPGGYMGEVVWVSDATSSFVVPAQYTVYRDLSGGIFPIANHTVAVGDLPILLETKDLPQ